MSILKMKRSTIVWIALFLIISFIIFPLLTVFIGLLSYFVLGILAISDLYFWDFTKDSEFYKTRKIWFTYWIAMAVRKINKLIDGE